ncbi:hypothetical protein WG66_008355 [Moniliophthora roreri]|nr:hypothetical protein WG66_008355 [Moniliophthora roreri]
MPFGPRFYGTRYARKRICIQMILIQAVNVLCRGQNYDAQKGKQISSGPGYSDSTREAAKLWFSRVYKSVSGPVKLRCSRTTGEDAAKL